MDSIADEAVVATNDYAAICKYQAVLHGYYKDAYIDKFLSAKAKNSVPRKAPEINRGHYARSTSIAYIVEKFVDRYPNGQIISMGAGYDTLFWRLNEGNLITASDKEDRAETNLQNSVKYVEIDMSSVVVHKIMAIRRHTILKNALRSIRFKGEGLHSNNYHLVSFDLRQVDKNPLRHVLIEDCQLDIERPTLCLFECVLIYMPIQDSGSLIDWLNKTFKHLTMVNYEQCNMSDSFGEVMKSNMSANHCDLMGVDACVSLKSQKERFRANGLSETKGWTLLEILKKCLLPASVERVFALEFLDEQELLEQLLEHYCIVIGSNTTIDWIPEDEYWLSKTTP